MRPVKDLDIAMRREEQEASLDIEFLDHDDITADLEAMQICEEEK